MRILNKMEVSLVAGGPPEPGTVNEEASEELGMHCINNGEGETGENVSCTPLPTS